MLAGDTGKSFHNHLHMHVLPGPAPQIRNDYTGDGTRTAFPYTFCIGSSAVLTVTVKDASRVYGADNPGFAFAYSGFVNGERLATSGVTGGLALLLSQQRSITLGEAINAAGERWELQLKGAGLTMAPLEQG